MCIFQVWEANWEIVTIIGVFGTFYLGHQFRIVLAKARACGWSDFAGNPSHAERPFFRLCTAAMIGKSWACNASGLC